MLTSQVDEKRASRSTTRHKTAKVEKRSLSSGFNPLSEETMSSDKSGVEEVRANVSSTEVRKEKGFGQMKAVQSGVS